MDYVNAKIYYTAVSNTYTSSDNVVLEMGMLEFKNGIVEIK